MKTTINLREESMNKLERRFFSVCLVCVIGFFISIGAQDYKGWSFKSGNQGQIVTMTISNPGTYLGVEGELTIEIGASGTPQGGVVKFKDGLGRDMSKQEASTYWDEFQGPHELWSYWESQGKLMTLKTNDAVPANWLGAMTRVITLSGGEVTGTLLMNNQQQYAIHSESACCGDMTFTMNAVTKLQQLRR